MSLKLDFPEQRTAKHIKDSLLAELGHAHERRSKTSVRVNNNILSLEIHSADKTAMKASINSYLKLIAMCNSLTDI